jgi:hypothetical protein
MLQNVTVPILLVIAVATVCEPRKLADQEKQYLGIRDFKIGAKGYPDGGLETTDVKIIQIVDANQMLIRLRDRRTLMISITVMLKHPTKGLVDDQYFGVWEDPALSRCSNCRITCEGARGYTLRRRPLHVARSYF